MQQQKVFILGCGWLGTAAGKSLIRHGYEVWGSTTTSSRLPELSGHGINPVLLDTGNRPGLPEDVMTGTGWLVLSLPPRQLASSLDWLTSILAKSGTNVLMISSTAVYPASGNTVKEEDARHQVSSHSGVDLLALEKAVQAACPSVILRPGGLYGPGRHPGNFLAGKTGLSNGSAPVNLIHQEDIVNIMVKLILQHSGPGTYNAVAPGHPSREEFYTRAALSLGLPPPRFSGEEDTNSFKIVDSSQIIKKLDYHFIHSDPMEDI